ncbi:putative N,O-diacetyl muramidase [Calycina marina]|uniref:Lysozyme n=1 Tax=Calycina marina TaxID=1763456 RepID=A0A9P7Z0B8_9HELO|nr:putative N,O-diacetyl muramidase [Calycina marina]
MKPILAITASLLSLTQALPSTLEQRAQPKGLDVSGYQPNINWSSVKANGAFFVYIKATEGTTYQNPSFSSQYSGATSVALVRGGYHFARPSSSSGAAQATYFLAHGGGWSADGRTLPGMLDLEYAPSGNTCYGLTPAAMVSWVRDFSDTYHAKTGRYPVIYTTTDWWKTCTGNSAAFGATNPLFIARYASAVGTLPAGWNYHTFWQFADSGVFPGDQDVFNGDLTGLKRLASG